MIHRFYVICVSFVFLLLASAHSLAVLPDEILKDPRLESRARDISSNLRCLVCQNESIDDSNAPLAKDLRLLVRERLTEGDSDQQVVDFLVARYGEFVLLKPQFNKETFILWLLPFAIIVLAGGVVVWRIKRKTHTNVIPLSEEEEKRLKRILKS